MLILHTGAIAAVLIGGAGILLLGLHVDHRKGQGATTRGSWFLSVVLGVLTSFFIALGLLLEFLVVEGVLTRFGLLSDPATASWSPSIWFVYAFPLYVLVFLVAAFRSQSLDQILEMDPAEHAAPPTVNDGRH